jgi:small-conductance mechanosensitive channel
MNGRANVVSPLLLSVWDKFHEHGIEIPYPQRDLHLRSSSLETPVDSQALREELASHSSP